MPFPLDPKWISEMEADMGVQLPLLYRGKLLKENGGELDAAGDHWFLYPVFDQSDKKRIARTCNSIARETKGDRARVRFPAEAISIGNNGAGDQLIMLPESPGSKQLGEAIYWWNHETGAVTKVADDVAELLLAEED
jgi:hypothetical protein